MRRIHYRVAASQNASDQLAALAELGHVLAHHRGLLPQVHRAEADIYDIKRLVAAADRPVPPLANVPNRYLSPKTQPRP